MAVRKSRENLHSRSVAARDLQASFEAVLATVASPFRGLLSI